MKKHVFRIGLVVTMLLGLMMISANAACDHENPHPIGSTHDENWEALTAQTAAKTLTAGQYYLDADTVTFAGKVTISGEVTICLNGNTFDSTFAGTSSGTDAIVLESGATLTICDCSSDQSGTIKTSHTASTSKLKRLIGATSGACTLNIWGGKLDYSNVTKGSTTSSTTIYTTVNMTLNMHGGEISGNSVGSGVVYFNYSSTSSTRTGVVNMCGGTMNNTKPGVYFRLDKADSTGTLNMTGGTIKGADEVVAPRAQNTGSTIVNISGSSVLGGGIRFANTTVTITGGTFSNITNLTASDGYYFYDNGNGTYTVYANGTEPEPEPDEPGDESGHEGWTALTADNFSTMEAGQNYYLTEDVTLSERYAFPAGEVTLCLHGQSLLNSCEGNAFTINVISGATVNLQDCDVNTTEGTISPAAGDDNNARGVLVSSGGTFNMYGGSITGFTNTSTANGGGVQLNGGTMNMYGGSITDNHADSALGGGVYLAENGKLTVSGGTISNNTATKGGGIYGVKSNTISVTSGTISNNTAELGGGIYGANTNVTINVKGGTISNNVATTTTINTYEGGGGIYAYGAKVNLSGGVLTGNEALYGGAVRLNNSATLTVSGDVAIHTNKAKQAGAALCVYNTGTINIEGGYIYSNVAACADGASVYGAAINLRTGATKLNISGGSIGIDPTGAAAANYCEGVSNSNGSIACLNGANTSATITGGQFYANEGDTLFGMYNASFEATTGQVQVSGGSFSSALKSHNLAEGCHDYALAQNANNLCPYVVDKKFAPSSVSVLVQNKNGFGLEFLINQADMPGVRSDYTVKFSNGASFDTGANGTTTYYYRFRGIAAKDMGDEVTLTFTNNGKTASSTTFSIKEYVTKVLEDSASSTELKQAVSDMLRYGAAAQTYFETGDTAVTDGMDELLADVSDVTLADESDLTADTNKLYKGSSLSLKNKIILNLYFDSSVTGVTVNGASVTLKDLDNGLKVAVYDGVTLGDVTTNLPIVITVEDNDPITVYDSVQAYAYRTTSLTTANDNLTALCQAMMNFVTSANAYLATQS